MSTSIITTADGSHTLFAAHFNEIYHSRHGALAESVHVFIRNGLEPMSNGLLNVFEVGFGTGLNALLALKFAVETGKEIHYQGIELYPVEQETALQLNYAEQIGDEHLKTFFEQMHTCKWNEQHLLTENFSFKKIHGSLLEANLEEEHFEVIFFDAFAPTKQSELWSSEIFEKLFLATKRGGVLTTYCAKGDVRRVMQQAGFSVSKVPGPPGKREMLVAIKPTV